MRLFDFNRNFENCVKRVCSIFSLNLRICLVECSIKKGLHLQIVHSKLYCRMNIQFFFDFDEMVFERCLHPSISHSILNASQYCRYCFVSMSNLSNEFLVCSKEKIKITNLLFFDFKQKHFKIGKEKSKFYFANITKKI